MRNFRTSSIPYWQGFILLIFLKKSNIKKYLQLSKTKKVHFREPFRLLTQNN